MIMVMLQGMARLTAVRMPLQLLVLCIRQHRHGRVAGLETLDAQVG